MDFKRGGYAPRSKRIQGREKDGQDQLVAGRAGGGDLAEIGEGSLDFLVPTPLCHHLVGKTSGSSKIARRPYFHDKILT